MASLKGFFKEKKSFVAALVMIVAALVGVYTIQAFKIHPITTAFPQYHRLWVLFVVGVLLGLVILVLLAVHIFIKPLVKKPDYMRLMTIVIGLLAITYIFIMPPMSSADDIRHYLAAYKLSNQMMFKEAVDVNNHVYMRAEDATIILNDFPGVDDYYNMVSLLMGPVDATPTLFTLEEPVECLWIAYFPAALGITIGRILALRQIPMMLLARVFTVIFFLIFFNLSIRKMPFGKEILFAICALPMMLNQIASYSYDVCVLALSFYFIAYVLDLAFMKDRVTRKDMIILTAVMAIMAPVKVVYLLLAFLMFIIPMDRFGSRKNYWLSALFMLLVVGGVFLALRIGKLSEYANETDPYLAYADANVYSFSFLLHNPLLVFKIFFNSIHVYGGSWFNDMLGYRLGWQDICIPQISLVCLTILMCFCAVKPAGEPVYFKGYQRAVGLFVACAVSAAAILAMLIVYTPDGAEFVYGVQGRYFLPVLPLFMLGIRCDGLRRRDDSNRWIIFSAAVLNYWIIACVIAGVMSRFGVTKMIGAN